MMVLGNTVRVVTVKGRSDHPGVGVGVGVGVGERRLLPSTLTGPGPASLQPSTEDSPPCPAVIVGALTLV